MTTEPTTPAPAEPNAPCNCRTNPVLTAQIGYPVRCPHCPPGTSAVPPTHWTKHVQRHHPDAAVLPVPSAATTDRTAVLLEAAAVAESLRQFERCTGPRRAAQTSENVGILRVATELRRLAAGAQQPGPDPLTTLTAPALLATIKELRDLRAPLVGALTTVYRSMKGCVGDEWAEEWLGEVWTQIPLAVRALAGDTDAADELAAGAQQQPTTETQPARGDQFETWLKEQRDLYFGHATTWGTVDGLLDLYRLHADTGTPLGEHVCEGRVVGDCECLEQPAPAVSPVEAAEELAARHHTDGWDQRAQGAQDVADLLHAAEREEQQDGTDQ